MTITLTPLIQGCLTQENSFQRIIILSRVTHIWLHCFHGKISLLAPEEERICRIFSVQPTKLALLLEVMMAMMILVELILVVPQGGDTMGAITANITSKHPSVTFAATWKKLHL